MKFISLAIVLILLAAVVVISANRVSPALLSPQNRGDNLASVTVTASATPSPTASPSATPTPKPLTFAEMNALYGPCAIVPTLMYHHIQQSDIARAKGYSGLNVTPETFQKQLAYLKNQGYNSIDVAQLIAFFEKGINLPKKSILLTFDDGYDDFATYAAPLLIQYGFKASMFLPTGLMENPGYLKWNTVRDLSRQGFYFGNHTWSHRNMGASLAVDQKEITTADTQLNDHELNANKVFVYPYGTISSQAINFLRDFGYTLAFTTKPGRILCQKQRLTLPRIRIGDTALSAYGL